MKYRLCRHLTYFVEEAIEGTVRSGRDLCSLQPVLILRPQLQS
jgi:hypothetical protein